MIWHVLLIVWAIGATLALVPMFVFTRPNLRQFVGLAMLVIGWPATAYVAGFFLLMSSVRKKDRI